MGRNRKYNEETKVLTIRLPISKYNEMKESIETLINRILKPLTLEQKLEDLRKSDLDEGWKKFAEIGIRNQEYEKEKLKQMLETGTKSQLIYRWRKWKKAKIGAMMNIPHQFNHIKKDKILKHKNWDKLKLDSYEDCLSKYGGLLSKKVMSKFSVDDVIENGKRIIEFLTKQQNLHNNHEIYENIASLKNYYDKRNLDNLYLLSRVNEENLEHCPHCLSYGEKKIAGKLDFDRIGRVVDRSKRFYEKAERYSKSYLIMGAIIRDALNWLKRIMKDINHCNEKIEMFRNALDKRFPKNR